MYELACGAKKIKNPIRKIYESIFKAMHYENADKTEATKHISGSMPYMLAVSDEPEQSFDFPSNKFTSHYFPNHESQLPQSQVMTSPVTTFTVFRFRHLPESTSPVSRFRHFSKLTSPVSRSRYSDFPVTIPTDSQVEPQFHDRLLAINAPVTKTWQ